MIIIYTAEKTVVGKTYYKDGKLKSEAIIENGITTLWKTYNRDREK